VIVGAMARGGLPAAALRAGGHPNHSTTQTGTRQPSQARAYGRFCQNESKKHVAGQRGTPYSVCVSGAKKLLKQQSGG
jgi:hypothetical protein